MRIARLTLDGIGPFDGAVFDIPPPPEGTRGELVLFEGPNGCGKTTIAQALTLAAYPHVTCPEAWSARFRTAGANARVEVEHGGKVVALSIGRGQIEHKGQKLPPAGAFGDVMDLFLGTEQGRPVPLEEWAAYSLHGRQSTPSVETSGPKEMDSLRMGHIFGNESAAKDLGQLLANLDYKRVRSAHYARDAATGEQRVRLEHAASANEHAIARMQEALSAVLDRRVEFLFDPDKVVPQILFDGEAIPLEYLGEGLRATLSWLTDLLVRIEVTWWERGEGSPYERDFWLILDEVEVNLHPRMQARLFPTLRRLFPGARIYATVHSPFAVAAAAEGHVFAIRPDARTRRVSGPQRAVKLEHGQSLSWAIEEVFDVPSLFLDEETRERLRAHDRDVRALGARRPIDWSAFLENRRWLLRLNEEVSTVVAMREVPVRRSIEDKLDEAAE